MSDPTDKSAEWLDDFREETDSQLGDAPPGFLLDELLGRGGMAEVYLAHRTGPRGFSRKVVIKRIRPDKIQEQDFVDRFIREASLTSKFHHPNIVEILELVTLDDAYYIVMEYLHGQNVSGLVERIAKQGLRCPNEVAAYVGASLSAALDYAHNFIDEDGKRHQIVHRDVSPDNVMLTYAGQVKLLDFGVAKDLDGTQLTQGDKVIGKPLYLPPESLNGVGATPARDVYSLGMTLYVLLTGRSPFDPGSGPEGLARLLVDIGEARIPPVREFNPDVSDELEHIVLRAISREPRNRYSAGEMHQLLESYLGQATTPVGQSALAQFLRTLFGDEAENSRPKPPPSGARMVSAGSGWSKRRSKAEIAATAQLTPAALRQSAEHATVVTRASRGAPKAAARTDGGHRVGTRTLVFGAGIAVLLAALIFALVALVETLNSGQRVSEQLEAIDSNLSEGTKAPLISEEPEHSEDAARVADEPEVPAKTSNSDGKGILEIQCKGLMVWVDERSVGYCPSVTTHVSPGKHKVSVERAGGVRKVKWVVIAAGEHQRVSVMPRRNTSGRAPIRNVPVGAE